MSDEGVDGVEPDIQEAVAPAEMDLGRVIYSDDGDSERKKKRETTRTALAWIMAATLLLLIGGSLYGLLEKGWTTDDMQAFSVVFSPVITLMGTIFGFYFASDWLQK